MGIFTWTDGAEKAPERTDMENTVEKMLSCMTDLPSCNNLYPSFITQ